MSPVQFKTSGKVLFENDTTVSMGENCCCDFECDYCDRDSFAELEVDEMAVRFDDVGDTSHCTLPADGVDWEDEVINMGIVACSSPWFPLSNFSFLCSVQIQAPIVWVMAEITDDTERTYQTSLFTQETLTFPAGVKLMFTIWWQSEFTSDEAYKVFYFLLPGSEPVDCASFSPATTSTYEATTNLAFLELVSVNEITFLFPAPAPTQTILQIDPVTTDPSDLDDLVGWWYDGNWTTDGPGRINTWTDDSSASRDFTQSSHSLKPVEVVGGLGGRDAASFDGSNDTMSFTNLTLNDFTFFAVLSRDASAAGADVILGYNASDYIAWDGSQVTVVGSGTSTTIGTTSVPNDQAFLLTVRRNNADIVRARINGKEMSGSGVSNSGALTTLRRLGRYGSTAYWYGLMGGIVVYDRALSEAEMSGLETDYFMDRWTIPEL